MCLCSQPPFRAMDRREKKTKGFYDCSFFLFLCCLWTLRGRSPVLEAPRRSCHYTPPPCLFFFFLLLSVVGGDRVSVCVGVLRVVASLTHSEPTSPSTLSLSTASPHTKSRVLRGGKRGKPTAMHTFSTLSLSLLGKMKVEDVGLVCPLSVHGLLQPARTCPCVCLLVGSLPAPPHSPS